MTEAAAGVSIRIRLAVGLAVGFAVVAAAPRSVRAGGFENDLQSPLGTSMAGALTAVAADASAIFYNPAGIAMRNGGDAMIGGSWDVTLRGARSRDGVPIVASATRDGALLPSVFVAAHVVKRFALGVGLYSQFGAGVEWPDASQGATAAAFPGRFIANSTTLQTATLNPTVAIRASDWISLGAGLDVVFASFKTQRALLLGETETWGAVGGQTRAVGFNVGVLAVLVPARLSAGFAYRSGMSLDFDGSAFFNAPPELASSLPNQSASFSLPLPHNLSGGVAVHALPGLTLTGDVRVTLWSDVKQIAVRFASGLPTVTTNMNWHDTVSLRVGLEYLVARSAFALRFGFGWDPSPVPVETLGPLLPSSSRWLITGGLGYTLTRSALKGFGFHAAYALGLSDARSSTNPDFPSVYSQQTHQVSFALLYHWGGGIGAGAGSGTGCGPAGCDHCERCSTAIR